MYSLTFQLCRIDIQEPVHHKAGTVLIIHSQDERLCPSFYTFLSKEYQSATLLTAAHHAAAAISKILLSSCNIIKQSPPASWYVCLCSIYWIATERIFVQLSIFSNSEALPGSLVRRLHFSTKVLPVITHLICVRAAATTTYVKDNALVINKY